MQQLYFIHCILILCLFINASDATEFTRANHSVRKPSYPIPAENREIVNVDNSAKQYFEALEMITKISPRNKIAIRIAKPKSVKNIIGDLTSLKGWISRFLTVPSVELANLLFEENESKYKEAIQILEKSGFESSHIDSLLLLGDMALYGYHSFPRNASLALHYYGHAARVLGDPKAQRIVGTMYAVGVGTKRDYATALVFMRFASAGKDLVANQIMGYWLHSGIGVGKNCEQAATYYRFAADEVIKKYKSGPPGGLKLPYPPKIKLADRKGGIFGSGASGPGHPKKDNPILSSNIAPEDIIQYYEFSAENGDLSALMLLGQLYYYGSNSVTKDFSKAFNYFTRAAKQAPTEAFLEPLPKSKKAVTGEKEVSDEESETKIKISLTAEAAGFLGMMYLRGEHVSVNYEKAKKWFDYGLKHGNAMSCNGLGLLHWKGLGGFKVDTDRAMMLFSSAALRLPESQMNLAQLMLETGKDKAVAYHLFTSASLSGNLFSLYRVGEMIMDGVANTPNCQSALLNFKTVVEKGDWEDPSILEAQKAFKNGDIETALLLYLFAAEKGVELAQSNAAFILDQGLYETMHSPLFVHNQDVHELAVNLWNRAANQGNVDARVKVGDYHYYGLGIKPLPNETNTVFDGNRKSTIYDEWFSFYPANFEKSSPLRAMQYYQIAADSERHAMAMWNLGYMFEYGVGLREPDLNLAKQHYERSLATNPDSYLAVNIALVRIGIKLTWKKYNQFSIVKFISYLMGWNEKSVQEDVRTIEKTALNQLPFEEDDLLVDKNSDINLLYLILSWFVSEYDNEMYNLIENAVILVLCGVVGFYIWQRQRRVLVMQQQPERARNALVDDQPLPQQ